MRRAPGALRFTRAEWVAVCGRQLAGDAGGVIWPRAASVSRRILARNFSKQASRPFAQILDPIGSPFPLSFCIRH